jgi:prophage maintenance system killer protein
MTDDLPTPGEILTIHERIEQRYDLKYDGLRIAAPRGKLRRDVIEPAAEYDDPYRRAATLLFGIQSAHVFEDANKRTAWSTTMEYLERKAIRPDFQQDEDTIERIIRRAGLFETDELAAWFETGEIDESRLPEH